MTRLLWLGIILIISQFSYSQNNTINYKALVKDNLGSPLVNQNIDIRFTIYLGATQIYQESHNTNTDSNGIAIVNIGAGSTSDIFTDINWSGGTTSLQTEIDSGSGFVNLGTTEFKSVPYALNSGSMTKVTENLNTGWRLETNPLLDGGAVANIGDKAVDMTIHDDGFWFFAGASGPYSFAVNKDNYATGISSAAFGSETLVSGTNSISAGTITNVYGSNSFGFGNNITIGANNALGIGTYNLDDPNALFMIGNGTISNRANVLTVTNTGKTTVLENTASSSEHAINGIKIHAGFSDSAGIYGENIINDGWGYGVKGLGKWRGTQGLVQGTGASSYIGIEGLSSGTNTGSNYGVYGYAFGGATNYAVYAAGDMNYTGTLTNVSDRKFKNNIQLVNNSTALEALLQLRPSNYTFKSEYIKSMNVSTKPQMGFIAQELQEVFPDLVTQNVHPGKTKNDPNIEYLGVNYIGLIPVLTAGIKEQQHIIEQQQQTIDAQQQLLQELLNRVEALENRD